MKTMAIESAKIYLCGKCELYELCNKREEREPVLNSAVELINGLLGEILEHDWIEVKLGYHTIRCKNYRIDKTKKDMGCRTCKMPPSHITSMVHGVGQPINVMKPKR